MPRHRVGLTPKSLMDMPLIRAERPADHAAVRQLHLAAFESAVEADLVEQLRARASPLVSLVALEDGAVVGHILFSPVTIDESPALHVMGLAPMAVQPSRQRSGIGTALVSAGLEACRALGTAAVVVLGHPTYYPRFGFVPASRFGLRSTYDVPDELFMAMELRDGALATARGVARFHEAFNDT